MLVNECATLPPITVGPETLLSDAVALMRDKAIRRLPVVDQADKLVGVVSERDLRNAVHRYGAAPVEVQDFMHKPVLTTTLDTRIQDAARIMLSNKVSGLPVQNLDGTVVGVVTETDIFKAFVDMLDRDEAA